MWSAQGLKTYTYWQAYKLVKSWFLVGTPVTYNMQFPPARPFKSLSYGNTRARARTNVRS